MWKEDIVNSLNQGHISFTLKTKTFSPRTHCRYFCKFFVYSALTLWQLGGGRSVAQSEPWLFRQAEKRINKVLQSYFTLSDAISPPSEWKIHHLQKISPEMSFWGEIPSNGGTRPNVDQSGDIWRENGLELDTKDQETLNKYFWI